MKKYIFTLWFCLILNSTFAQEEEILGWNYSEIFIITRGLATNETIRYKFEGTGTIWTKPDTNPPSNYTITTSLNLSNYPPTNQYETGNTAINSPIFQIGGFNFIGGNNQVDPYAMDSFGYGLYKFGIVNGNTSFYLSYKDNRYRNYYNTPEYTGSSTRYLDKI